MEPNPNNSTISTKNIDITYDSYMNYLHYPF